LHNTHKTKTIQYMKAFAYMTFTVLTLSFSFAQRGQVNIEQDEKIEQLLAAYKSTLENSGYYTIQVGFGSLNKANSIKSQVEVDFPSMSSKIDFKEPTYRVRLGRFKTKIQAERNFIRVRKKYPQAMLLKPKK